MSRLNELIKCGMMMANSVLLFVSIIILLISTLILTGNYNVRIPDPVPLGNPLPHQATLCLFPHSDSLYPPLLRTSTPRRSISLRYTLVPLVVSCSFLPWSGVLGQLPKPNARERALAVVSSRCTKFSSSSS